MSNADFNQPNGQQFFCTVKIKDIQFNSSIIFALIIREWVLDVLPKIQLDLSDDGTLNEVMPLDDNEVISILIGKTEQDESPLELEFQVQDYKMNVMGENKRLFFSITGILKTNNMFMLRNRSFSRSTSKDICSQIASEEGLTFKNPLNVIPIDNMTWYQSNMNNYNFIKYVLNRSCVNDDAAFFYANTQKEFVYTSLNKEIDKAESIDAIYDINKSFSMDLNNLDKRKIWFNSYDVVNMNGYFNKKIAYGFAYSYYDLSKSTQAFEYNKYKLMAQKSFKDKNLDGKVFYGGNDLGIYNDLNLYEKYFESLMRNKYLINGFFGYSILLNINSLYKVKLFDKVNLGIPSLFPENKADINEVVSGEYLVGGIIHQIGNNGIYTKTISLHRNGSDKSAFLDKMYKFDNSSFKKV
jgi:hypothetical protein